MQGLVQGARQPDGVSARHLWLQRGTIADQAFSTSAARLTAKMVSTDLKHRDGELIHADHFEPIKIHRPQAALHGDEIQLLDRLPVQPEEGGHVPHGGHAAQLRDGFAPAPRHSGVGIQPVQVLQLGAAPTASHAQARQDQFDPVFEDG